MSLTILVVTLLINLGIGLSDASNGCHFNLNCKHNTKILEFPTYPVPLKFIVRDIYYEIQRIDLSDPRNCLSQLLLDHNFSFFYPFKPYLSRMSETTNISVFDCSSVVQLRNDNQMDDGVQDIKSCPIYVTNSEFETIIDSDLVYCIKLFDRVSSFDGAMLQYNRLELTWSGTNFDIGCLKCEHKLKKKIAFIILSTAG